MLGLPNNAFSLQRHRAVGRSFDEYLGMFDLSEDDLARDIVGVGDGPASFNFRMNQRGTPIISVDPIYQFSEVELRQRIQETYDELKKENIACSVKHVRIISKKQETRCCS